MFFIFVLAAVAVSALPFAFGTVYYMVADDYLLNYIANGSYGFAYSDHLTFLKMPLGILLKLLYSVTTSVNWYLLLLMGIAILSFALLHQTVWTCTKSLFFLALSFVIQYFLIAEFLSFTVVAYVAALAGICRFFGAVLCERKTGKRAGFVLIGFLFLSYLLREKAVPGVVLVLLPLCFLLLKHLRRLLPSLLLPLLVGVLLVSMTALLERQAYSDPDWQAFQEYDEARSLVVDHYAPPYASIEAELLELSVSRLDYNLLNSWRFNEQSAFPAAQLREVAAIYEEGTTYGDRVAYLRSYLRPRLLPFYLFPCLFLLCLLFGRRMKHPLLGLWMVLLTAGILFMLAFFRMRFVMRVVVPTELSALYGLLLLTCSPEKKEPFKARMRRGVADLLSACLLILVLLQFLSVYRRMNYVERVYPYEAPRAALTEEIERHPDTLYVVDSSVFSQQFYFGTPASQVKTTALFQHVVRSGSWDSYSPRYMEQVRAFLQSPEDLLTGLVEEPHLAYVTNNGTKEIEAFYLEQTGKSCRATEQTFPDLDAAIYRFTS